MKKLYVVGLGPGREERNDASGPGRPGRCGIALRLYRLYSSDSGPLSEKETLATPMMQEIQRCEAALKAADTGRTVAMVCSGDAGVYGMASPILELAPDFPEVEIEIVPELRQP